jgi:hypothetical protein
MEILRKKGYVVRRGNCSFQHLEATSGSLGLGLVSALPCPPQKIFANSEGTYPLMMKSPGAISRKLAGDRVSWKRIWGPTLRFFLFLVLDYVKGTSSYF